MLSDQKIRIQVNCEKDIHVEFVCSKNEKIQEKEGISLELTETKIDGCQLGTLKMDTKKTIFDNNINLALENAVRVYLPLKEKPEKITAMYMLNDWWTTPAFIDKCQDIPARTQIAYFKYANKVVCFVPMIGNNFKSILNGGTEKEIGLDMSSFLTGQNRFEEPIYLISEGPTYFEAVHCAFKYLAKMKNILTRQERHYPEMFEYLGWCSWDAMRTDVNEKGIRDKASEFANKKVPVNWILIDDGWFPGQDGMINGFLPDPKKFPNKFKQIIEDIKSNSQVRWFGVWHALPGYWNGVVPESSLAKEESSYLYETKGGYLVPSPTNGSRFYYH